MLYFYKQNYSFKFGSNKNSHVFINTYIIVYNYNQIGLRPSFLYIKNYFLKFHFIEVINQIFSTRLLGLQKFFFGFWKNLFGAAHDYPQDFKKV